jgi:ribulose-phosphate 3-epimerase
MDNRPVPNLTIDHWCCNPCADTVSPPHGRASDGQACRPAHRRLPEAGADWISIHPEATEHVHRSLSSRKVARKRASSSTRQRPPPPRPRHGSSTRARHVGQSWIRRQAFIPSSLTSCRGAPPRRRERTIDTVEIDGGIKVSNIAAAARAGADTFVAGSAIFGSGDYAATIAAMKSAGGADAAV